VKCPFLQSGLGGTLDRPHLEARLTTIYKGLKGAQGGVEEAKSLRERKAGGVCECREDEAAAGVASLPRNARSRAGGYTICAVEIEKELRGQGSRRGPEVAKSAV